jgi:hypothetical protein
MASVQVVVRLRPMNSKETKEGTLPVITASTSNKSVTVIKGVGAKQARSQFTFDNVFTSFSTQHDVFSVTLRPVIADVLKGFETCVFAYGQVGKLNCTLTHHYSCQMARGSMFWLALIYLLVKQ